MPVYRSLALTIIVCCLFVVGACGSDAAPPREANVEAGQQVLSPSAKETVQLAAVSPAQDELPRPVAYESRPLVLYSLADEIFQRPRTEIPYYRNGDILFLEEEAFLQHDEGHQPWLANGVDVVTAGSAKLTGEEAPFLEAERLYNGKIVTTSPVSSCGESRTKTSR